MTFTSAPAAASLLPVAEELGQQADWWPPSTTGCSAIAVGPVTAGPLDAAGVPSPQPERARLGALAREVVARLPERDPRPDRSAPTRCRSAATPPSSTAGWSSSRPGPMAVLRELARCPGTSSPGRT